jgi:hypothetical protein
MSIARRAALAQVALAVRLLSLEPASSIPAIQVSTARARSLEAYQRQLESS